MSEEASVAEVGELYSPAARAIQDRFDSRRLADRLAEITVHDALEPAEQAFIERASFFYLATVDDDGWPDVSYKGGAPGFVRALDGRTLVFPSYDGNGMFRSMGNIAATARVGLLFMQFDPGRRVRVQGTASLHDDAELMEMFPESQLVVRVAIGRIFPNCPRYVHDLASGEISEFVPQPGRKTPVPEWKTWDLFADALPKES